MVRFVNDDEVGRLEPRHAVDQRRRAANVNRFGGPGWKISCDKSVPYLEITEAPRDLIDEFRPMREYPDSVPTFHRSLRHVAEAHGLATSGGQLAEHALAAGFEFGADRFDP